MDFDSPAPTPRSWLGARRRMVVWVVSNPALAQPCSRTTRTVPTVFVQVADARGQRASSRSLARPGGYTTGFTNFEDTMGSKWLELLHELAPGENARAAGAPPVRRNGRASRPFGSHHRKPQLPLWGSRWMGRPPRHTPTRPISSGRNRLARARRRSCGLVPLPHPLTIINAGMIIAIGGPRQLPAV